MRYRRLAAWACAFTVSLTIGGAQAEPVKIRIDWSTIPGQFAPLIPSVPKYAPNVYRHYGKSYVVEPIRLQGGGASLTALAADQVDIATLSPQTLVLGVSEAKLEMRVIGQQISTEVPGYLLTHFWVRGSEVKRIEDLKGKVVAVNARGANVDSAAHIVMRKAGLEEPRDYQIAEVRFPAMIAALESKRVDAVPLVPPFDRIAARNPEFKRLFSVGDAFGPVETLMFMTKAAFVSKNRAALVDLLEDNIRMRRWMFDPKTRMDAVTQLSDTTKIPVAEYAEWVYTTNDYYYHPQALTDVQRLQHNVEVLKQAGVIPAAINVTPYVDLSLVKEAAARVKD
jgi:ABC-type nitrate/sulfonate/bicarbonate transport system substrate-binding protein